MIRCIQIGTTTVQGRVVYQTADMIGIRTNGRLFIGRPISTKTIRSNAQTEQHISNVYYSRTPAPQTVYHGGFPNPEHGEG